MNVAFCINDQAFIGLGPTLSSLIRSCSKPDELKIYFLCSGVSINGKEKISDLLRKEKFEGSSFFIDFDAEKIFGHLRSLHGDWTTYGRLLLPELVKKSTVLYLDADLIIELDVLEIEKLNLEDSPFGAVTASNIKHSLDNTFLNGRLGIPLETKYFNAGILYFNLDVWRHQHLKDKCLSLANQYPNELVSHDQTLLNAVFGDNFKHLPRKFNCAWYAHSKKPVVADRMIIHFLGSPKPWDPGAKYLHNAHTYWKSYLENDWRKAYHKFSIDSLKRVWKIHRSYLRVMKRKFK